MKKSAEALRVDNQKLRHSAQSTKTDTETSGTPKETITGHAVRGSHA
jgi:hypothetical protein